MEKLSKYRETIIFVSCATALVGTVLVLQKATTPSQHRRHAGSSASHGVPRSRSASRGPAGARSRSSSRVRVSQLNTKEGAALTASTNPVTAPRVGDCTHASRSRDASHAQSHRHHGHLRSTASAAAETNGAAVKPPEPVAADLPKKRLTVEAVEKHTKALGTASALQNDLLAVNAAGAVGALRDGWAGGGDGNDGANYRNASTAATVGSQALHSAAVASPTIGTALSAVRASGGMSDERALGLPPRSPRVDEGPQLPALPARDVSQALPPVNSSVKNAAGNPRVQPTGAATQTTTHRFRNDHSTQTEKMDERRLQPTASVTPDRWTHTAMISPILPSGEGNDSAILNCEDFGWTPVRDADFTKPINTAALPHDGNDAQVAVPKYFLLKLESQIRVLVRSISDDEGSERAWMRLYVYLSELPPTVRRALAMRGCCGVTPSFISLATTMSQKLTYLPLSAVECAGTGRRAATAGDIGSAAVGAAASAPSSLPREVLHLLQHGTPEKAVVAIHFEWINHRCVAVTGDFVCNATGQLFPTAVGAGRDVAAGCTQEPLSASALSAAGNDIKTDDDEDRSFSVLIAVAKHIEAYNVLLSTEAASHPTSGLDRRGAPEEGAATHQVDYQTPVRNGYGRRTEEAALTQQFHGRQQQLLSFLMTVLQLKQTDSFQALRQSSQFAPFACDFIELASSAQRLLDSGCLSPDCSTLQPMQVPTALKPLVPSEMTDARDTSIGTTTSTRSDSSPISGAANRTRRGVKVRTPMKPSIRYPIHCALSKSPSHASVSQVPAGEALTSHNRLLALSEQIR
ncbi:hypothetical protein ABL78_0023 [Leptomonas seymouri]|uniref:Uncharacterized protein n=1 Tax=Leptomonas seymouri TaxID=5684 RepID=A0A0N1I482_LEPSE|nr:hypothetical protein ABL78_0023 [Leptomonas seymouri]|eukprot:KPI90790.1 hypothetical protein ABL78_0023 [Leptomonas seymouri]